MAVLALVALLDRVFMPSVRWFLRRRINAVIDQVNQRLDVRIRPFQLTRRRVLIQRLIYDPVVMEALEKEAVETQVPRDALSQRVKRYAQEIVPAFNAYLYYRFGYWLAKHVVQLMYRVSVRFRDQRELESVDTNATIVFMMNHRSNMDYVLVSFLASQRTTLSYAVGEWARVWPLQSLIKSMGAYFVRRNSGNPLYRRVLERYIAMATKEGVCQAAFPEGGLSKDGALKPAKLGLLDYMLRNFDHKSDRDVIFIPVGINYDRTLEDRSLIRSLDPDQAPRSRWFAAKTTGQFLRRNLALMIRSRWRNFGIAAVVFGRPISAAAFAQKHNILFSSMDRESRFEAIKLLADEIMTSIATEVPVLPFSALCTILLAEPNRTWSRLDLKTAAADWLHARVSHGSVAMLDDADLEDGFDAALDMLLLRRFVHQTNHKILANEDERDILAYYANSISHLP